MSTQLCVLLFAMKQKDDVKYPNFLSDCKVEHVLVKTVEHKLANWKYTSVVGFIRTVRHHSAIRFKAFSFAKSLILQTQQVIITNEVDF